MAAAKNRLTSNTKNQFGNRVFIILLLIQIFKNEILKMGVQGSIR